MTWNIRGSARPDLAAIGAVIAAKRPDAIAVQEIGRRQADTLAKILRWHHCWARKHYPYSSVQWRLAEGLAIMSPHPLSHTTSHSLSPDRSTWTHHHRIALATSVQRDRDPAGDRDRGDRGRRDTVRIYNVHLAAGRLADERITQAGRVAALIAAQHPSLTVVAGDLNAGSEVEVIRELHRGGVHDPGGGPTYPSIAPRARFDFILVPDASVVTDRHEPSGGDDWRRLSDHLPVTIDFAPNPQP